MRTENARPWNLEAEPTTSDRIELDLQQRARKRIREGRLACIRHYRTWGGRGSDQPCALCDLLIGRDQVEYEIEALDATSELLYRFHFQCHDAWQCECAQAT